MSDQSTPVILDGKGVADRVLSNAHKKGDEAFKPTVLAFALFAAAGRFLGGSNG